jgi:hypothetical protein
LKILRFSANICKVVKQELCPGGAGSMYGNGVKRVQNLIGNPEMKGPLGVLVFQGRILTL